MKISEMITDRYKLRIPSTVYYDLLADVQEMEDEQRPKFIAKSDGTIEQIKNCNECLFKKEWEKIGKLLSVVLEKQTEQEPTTKNDLGVDLISRADVLKLMQDNWHTHNGDWAMQESMDDIRALPSVTPQEPKTGHWIDTNDDGFIYHRIYKCTQCGATLCEYPQNIQDFKYCSNCGAKMVEPQESEDKE